MSHTALAWAKPLIQAPNGEKIKPSEKLVLLLLADYHNDEQQQAWPSVSRLARESGDRSKRAVQLNLRSLENKGLLKTIFRCGEPGKSQSSLYSFPTMTKKHRIAGGGEECFATLPKEASPKPLSEPISNPLSPQPLAEGCDEIAGISLGTMNAIVRRIFDYYLSTMGKNPKVYTLTRLRLQKGRVRLRECLDKTGNDMGKAEGLMRLVVDKCAESDFTWAETKRQAANCTATGTGICFLPKKN